MQTLILASASPRRVQILKRHGLCFEQEVCPLEEIPPKEGGPAWFVTHLATQKAQYIAQRHDRGIVIGADTTVCLGSKRLGKPENEEKAAEMLRSLSGRSHEVITGVCIIDILQKKQVQFAVRSNVTFGKLDDAWISWYISTGEPMDKAGAYAIQGLAKEKITCFEGDLENIIGLPGNAVVSCLQKLGAEGEE